ncbi:LOW QUALITY PROTEIN: hypothetical protein MXB_2522 [Myxobolus squamalis]|nr:LOW QUALITY PROTEIN: hypothetical protein MXB_2522 [Myxobolus squamalis]
MPAPFALFYIDRLRKHMKIIAIQLTRKESDNEVFFPSDPQPIWVAAKMWFNNAEAIIHKASVLIGNSHILLESVATSVHRQLSPSHPVFRLLIFCIRDVIPINKFESKMIIFEIVPLTKIDGYLQRTTNIGSDGCIKLVERGWDGWRMNIHGWLPSDMEARGVLRSDILPHYPYRDDAILLFEAFHIYVKEILSIYYGISITNNSDTPAKLADDWEVQNLAKELTCSTGASLKGVFGAGSFDQLEDLEKTVTSIIYLSFIHHPAVSLPQYDNYATFTTYSTLLMGDPPSHAISPNNWPNQMTYLPSKNKCMEMLAINMALSDREANGLGNFNLQYLYDQRAAASKKRLVNQLRHISQIINERNAHRTIKYDYLNPLSRK